MKELWSWNTTDTKYKNFTDKGNYVIIPDEYTISYERETAKFLQSAFIMPNGGCTCTVKRNQNDEVIIGRNMDVNISQCPCFIAKTSYGTYPTVNIAYFSFLIPSYHTLIKTGELPPWLYAAIPYIATDVMNSKGLYIQTNMRQPYDTLNNYGTAGNEETENTIRLPWYAIPAILAQNCATVKEAVSFLKNRKNGYSFYTILNPSISAISGRNGGFIIADATGEYGLIEIAHDTVYYIPYANGQANFYVSPQLMPFDIHGTGTGRMTRPFEYLAEAQTHLDMMKLMETVMWKHEVLWIEYAKLNADNSITFQDSTGMKTVDWRSDYTRRFPITKDGKFCITETMYEEIKASAAYNPKILSFYTAACNAGQICIDHDLHPKLGRVTYKGIPFSEIETGYQTYKQAIRCDNATKNSISRETSTERKKKYRDYYILGQEMRMNLTTAQCLSPSIFLGLQARIYDYLNRRRNGDTMSMLDKLHLFYDKSNPENETPLRNIGEIWTTSLHLGVNCSRKELVLKLWENDAIQYSFSW